MFIDIAGVWCIEPNAAREYLRVYASILARKESGLALTDAQKAEIEAATGKQLKNPSGASTAGTVGSIVVSGPITKRGSMFSEVSGMASVDSMRAAFDNLNSDPNVSGILFDFDSPGGHINGIADFAEHIKATKSKPVVAYSDGMMASAAYWIGAAADQIVISKTAQIGSIGAVMRFTDDSKMMESIGIEDVEILDSNAPLKSENHRDDEVRAHLQQAINDAGDAFRASVAKFRGVSVETVRSQYGRGGIMVGKRALQAGLADRIATQDQVIKELSSGTLPQLKNPKSEVKSMGAFEEILVSLGWKQPQTETPQEPVQTAAEKQREIDLQAQLAAAQAQAAQAQAQAEAVATELAAAQEKLAATTDAQVDAQAAALTAQVDAFEQRYADKIPPAALTDAQQLYAQAVENDPVFAEQLQTMLDKMVETTAGAGTIDAAGAHTEEPPNGEKTALQATKTTIKKRYPRPNVSLRAVTADE